MVCVFPFSFLFDVLGGGGGGYTDDQTDERERRNWIEPDKTCKYDKRQRNGPERPFANPALGEVTGEGKGRYGAKCHIRNDGWASKR